MKQKTYRWMLISVLCICLLPFHSNAQIGISKQQGDEIIGGIVAVAAVAGGVIVFVIYHNHQSQSIRGCAESGPNGLELQNEGDQKTFQLLGITAQVKPGDRVRVKGKRKKAAKGSSGNPAFLVDSLTKDYGACTAPATKP